MKKAYNIKTNDPWKERTVEINNVSILYIKRHEKVEKDGNVRSLTVESIDT